MLMRIFLFLLLFAFSSALNAQSGLLPLVNDNQKEVFIDSVAIGQNVVFLNLDRIKSIDIKKDASGKGQIYISTDSVSSPLLSFSEMMKRYGKTTREGKSLVCLVDGKPISNLSLLRIDSSCIAKVEVIPSTALASVQKDIAEFDIVTVAINFEKKVQTIRIRGESEGMFATVPVSAESDR